MNFRINEPEIVEFAEKDPVIYIPNHAQGNINHEDCESGIVSSMNEKYVFVKFYRNKFINITVDEALTLTAQACKRENLKHERPSISFN